MKDYISDINRFYESRSNSNLYNEWLYYNSSLYMRYFVLIALAVTSILIPFDFLLYDSPLLYSSVRGVMMTAFIIMLVIVFKYYNNKNFTSPLNLIVLIPSLSYNIAYTYFLYRADYGESYYRILLLAVFLVILISSLFIYRFWKEQYVLTLISVIALFVLSIYKPEISQDIIRLICFHLVAMLACMYFRHQFLTSLSGKYQYMSSLLPHKFAKRVTVTERNFSIEKLFPTKKYFAVCLCSDWRNYQKITTTSEHEEVQDMLERFYETIYAELYSLDLDGQYYADWTADELFITFYGNDSQKEQIISESLQFCHNLSTKLYIDISNSINKGIKYDIGLSSGYGLIGLQGPGKFKKTTITGDVAGNAKRFETQAKEIRIKQDGGSFPIVVMDEKLKDAALDSKVFNTQSFTELEGSVKDIEGENLAFWQFRDN